MNIFTLCVGKTDEQAIEQLLQKYEKRFPTYINYQRLELADIKNRKTLTIEQQKSKEADLLLQRINKGDLVVLLDEKGKQINSTDFAQQLQNDLNQSVKTLIFVIGGPYGFDDRLYQRANRKLSLSQMTFTHQMVRLFLTEQIYRAFTILQNKPYHHE
ncbi:MULTISPECIES: 23S rRNA (pseudouridine(1915)-N(3))-methyltransferase RlmH [Weeksella]|uniref:Ribosomal RNA large subunit methyltransferase H n=1 Tax=Weeksella virosa (strain ATCC 43766 / DSM 16922 / JCM 21250 / CCUG 30538 / CDC 9751 / IAM 14551 / NBRC 16016 / NCTC 11634 / CL345/78) TaxID=865938 RepID=F0NZ72_WEEVC|nr:MULTISPECIES: 23S rRNA (pseudouridine(1915)-N(3))-methyltransferase RlmH [Weeksella]ADX68289.1 Ribosomal RNA large subunit methyltransferase H [Weeksella virosa DSM 16922]MDK7374608.1 23S rRNA (pseudouridine(1915)-N(3))-methyltransferase RlmH [Weeksella virosa]MDK7674756.1 23S rRNA (pseudouridine(1915)-N(3))-methyltransferase RlmH [Weeksella virosa]OFM83202.1 23S rRNA (pseudouridine(1915)-N(3))-methyltransferase RlmH [Weeksella sp. HMSC059D05]SUP54602.1 Ribosomal RNA large subunit methyltra